MRLRLPRSLYEGKQKYITLGLADTDENQAIAEEKRVLAERDIKLGMFDETFNKYKTGRYLALVEVLKPTAGPQLDELWSKFLDFKAPQCSPSTMGNSYRQFTVYLERMPHKSLDEAGLASDWIVANLPNESGNF